MADVYEKARSAQAVPPPPSSRNGSNHGEKKNGAGYAEAVRLYKPKSVSFLRQIKLLVGRYVTVLLRDVRTLGIMLLQAPLIAVLLALVFKTGKQFSSSVVLLLHFHFGNLDGRYELCA